MLPGTRRYKTHGKCWQFCQRLTGLCASRLSELDSSTTEGEKMCYQDIIYKLFYNFDSRRTYNAVWPSLNHCETLRQCVAFFFFSNNLPHTKIYLRHSLYRSPFFWWYFNRCLAIANVAWELPNSQTLTYQSFSFISWTEHIVYQVRDIAPWTN